MTKRRGDPFLSLARAGLAATEVDRGRPQEDAMKKINLLDDEKELTMTWFFDDIPQEYRDFRHFAQAVDQEYQELRQVLAKTSDLLKTQGADPELQARSAYLTKRIARLEEKFPFLVSEQLLEYALWGVPH